jgi:hypothetical protein
MKAKKQVLLLFPLNADKGYFCECCGAYVKRYKRSFNANMALSLLLLYKSERKFQHMETLISESKYKRCGDFSYLVHYGLIKALKGEREDGSPRNGYYQITGTGIMFAEGKTTVQEKFIMFKGKHEGFEGKEIDIYQALGNKFNYSELMK